MKINLMWFREDLRLNDNPALYYAAKSANVAGIYLISPTMLRKHDVSDNKIIFIIEGLEQLQKQLAAINISLKIMVVEDSLDIKHELLKYALQLGATALYFNKQYEFNEKKRDEVVTEHFIANDIVVKSFHDQCLFEPGTILTHGQNYFQVYTPFKNACWKKIEEGQSFYPLSKPKKQAKMIGSSNPVPRKFSNFDLSYAQSKFLAGELVAKKQLESFIERKIINYKTDRDFPAIDGTSKLSPYFAAGMISVQQCFAMTMQWHKDIIQNLPEGAITWLNELLWREFYRHIVVGFPRVSKHKPFKLATDKIPWDYNQELLEKWQQGQTGFPIVDAAMQQLNQTGWMHNRLRMIVAMFLSKNLFLDWRLGEKYFMENLIDGDLASNNGGWQWSASTGVDAVPYFRIFNPIRQSERFDPKGEFIRQFVPELTKLDNKAIHHPENSGVILTDYPKPIIDLRASKERVMKAFGSIRN